MASRKIRSRWLMNGNRKPLAHVRIAGLNLQGKPQKSSLSIFSFGSRELQTTIFIVQFSIGSYRWMISKSFEEIREFHNVILTDSTLRSGREYFTVSEFLLLLFQLDSLTMISFLSYLSSPFFENSPLSLQSCLFLVVKMERLIQ